MKEKFERFKNEKIVINVRSQKQYDDFMKMCEEQGLKWNVWVLATSGNVYNWYKEETCISYNFSFDDSLGYSGIKFYERENWKVIKYKDFIKTKQFTKSDLKDNHIVVTNEGGKYIWEKDSEIYINEDLTDCFEEKSNINEVWEFDKCVWKREEQILDEAEKEYLSYVIRPFRDRVRCIRLINYVNTTKQFIAIDIKGDAETNFPLFEKGTMYKNMELYKEYTLKELGLED